MFTHGRGVITYKSAKENIMGGNENFAKPKVYLVKANDIEDLISAVISQANIVVKG